MHFFLICLSCSFQNLSYMTQNTPFFRILHVFFTLNDVHAFLAWSWKTTLITWIFGWAWYPPWHSSAPPGAGMWLCNLAPMHSRTHYSHTNPSQYLYSHKDPTGSLGLGKIQRGPWVRSEVKSWFLKRYYTRNQTLACFVLYLKIINTFLKKKKYMHLISKLSQELETGIKI